MLAADELVNLLSDLSPSLSTLLKWSTTGKLAHRLADSEIAKQSGAPAEADDVAPAPRRATILSETQIDALAADHLAGLSNKALMAKYKVSRTTLVRHLHRRGLGERRSTRKYTQALIDEFVRLYTQDGLTQAEIAHRHNLGAQTINRLLGDEGVTLRDRGAQIRRMAPAPNAS